MICIQNKGYEVSLEKGKVYHVKEDTALTRRCAPGYRYFAPAGLFKPGIP